MVWQLLNKTAALAEGIDNARFTRQFMVVAPGLIVYERLLDAFCGRLAGWQVLARIRVTSTRQTWCDTLTCLFLKLTATLYLPLYAAMSAVKTTSA